MNLGLAGKRAIVTGAAMGLGKTIALALVAEGCRVALFDIEEEPLAGLTEEINAGGGDAFATVLDVRSPDACAAAVDTAARALGGLDILCNNAGIAHFTALADLTPEIWLNVFAVNVHGPLYLIRAAMPHLLASSGNVVNIASSAALMGHAYMAAYNASKAALTALTKSLAMEFIKTDVRINAIAPNGMATRMGSGDLLPEGIDMDLVSRYVPMRGNADPREVADLVLYLASARASRLHGSIVSADGGSTAG